MKRTETIGQKANLVVRIEGGTAGPLVGCAVELCIEADVLSPPIWREQIVQVRYTARGKYAEPRFVDAMLTPGRMVLLRNCELAVDAKTQELYWTSSEHTWIESENEVRVLSGMCRVATKMVAERESLHADVLFPEEAMRLRTAEDLQLFAAQWMRETSDGVENNHNSLIRLIAPASGQVMTSWVYAARREVRAGTRHFTLPGDLQSTWEEAFVTGQQSSGLPRVVAAALGVEVGAMSAKHKKLAAELMEDVSKGGVVVEMIPGQRFRAVLGTEFKRFHRTRTSLGMAAGVCESPSGPLFAPMTVILQVGGRVQDGMRTAVLYKAEPDVGFKRYDAQSIPTAILRKKGA